MGRFVLYEWCLSIGPWAWDVFLRHSLYCQRLTSDRELGAPVMGREERANRESWWGKGMVGRCLGSVRERTEIGNVFPGLEFPRGPLSE